LDIFDVSGRRVRTLVDASLPAGSHQVEWDSRGDSRESLSSGVYHYRLQAGSEAVERKMVLLR
jgi:flagellar hook assembly protein FlgD